MKKGSLLPDPLAGIEDEEALAVEIAGLKPRHAMFVHAYMRHRNGAQAAREAGYAAPFARNAAVKLKSRPDVRNVLNSMLNARLRRMQATPEIIERELMRVARGSLGRLMTVQADGTAYLDFYKADEDDLAGLASFKCEIEHRPGDDRDSPKQVLKMEAKLGNKLGALSILAQIHGMTGDDGANALVDIADAIRSARKRSGLEGTE